jgi:nucleoside-diphosphate-sugar epimerase
MNILVTGASGRVGSRLVPRLLAHGDAVRVLVRNEEQARSFEALGAQSVNGDLLSPETLDQAAARMESVVHLAAFFRGASESEARAVNYEGTLALARAVQEAGVSKFVYISTNLVYGPGRGRPVREDDDPQPEADHVYPASKLDAERALAQFFADRNVDLYILRLAFVHGDGDPHLREALNMTRSWPGKKCLQTVHHADVAQAILLSLTKDVAGEQIFNVADDSPTPIAEIRQMHGLSAAEFPADGEVGDPWEGIVDTTKIKRQLGFRPIYPSIQAAEAANAL